MASHLLKNYITGNKNYQSLRSSESWNRCTCTSCTWFPFLVGQVWWRPYLRANFGLFELLKFPWSPSIVEVGTFYPIIVKVGFKNTFTLLEALVSSDVACESIRFSRMLSQATSDVFEGGTRRIERICDAQECRKLAVSCRSEGGSCSRCLEISSTCLFYLRKNEILFLARSGFVVTHLCLVTSRRRDCSKKVKDRWFVGVIFLKFGRQVNVLPGIYLQNAE